MRHPLHPFLLLVVLLLSVFGIIGACAWHRERTWTVSPWRCTPVGDFRYAALHRGNLSKIVTTQGEYMVLGIVSGAWNAPVLRCVQTVSRTTTWDNVEIHLGDRAWREL